MKSKMQSVNIIILILVLFPMSILTFPIEGGTKGTYPRTDFGRSAWPTIVPLMEDFETYENVPTSLHSEWNVTASEDTGAQVVAGGLDSDRMVRIVDDNESGLCSVKYEHGEAYTEGMLVFDMELEGAIGKILTVSGILVNNTEAWSVNFSTQEESGGYYRLLVQDEVIEDERALMVGTSYWYHVELIFSDNTLEVRVNHLFNSFFQSIINQGMKSSIPLEINNSNPIRSVEFSTRDEDNDVEILLDNVLFGKLVVSPAFDASNTIENVFVKGSQFFTGSEAIIKNCYFSFEGGESVYFSNYQTVDLDGVHAHGGTIFISNDDSSITNDSVHIANCYLSSLPTSGRSLLIINEIHEVKAENNFISLKNTNFYSGGLSLNNCDNITLHNLEFIDSGIYVKHNKGSITGFDLGSYSAGEDTRCTVNGKPIYYKYSESNFTNLTVGDVGQIILIECENFTINNFSVSNLGKPIDLFYCNNGHLSNGSVKNAWDTGIFDEGSNKLVIRDCLVREVTRAGIILSGNNSIVENNVFLNCPRALRLLGPENVTISGNTISYSEQYSAEYKLFYQDQGQPLIGIEFSKSYINPYSSGIISSNKINGAMVGIAGGTDAVGVRVINNEITGFKIPINTSADHDSCGVLLCSYGTLHNWSFKGNIINSQFKFGIRIEGKVGRIGIGIENNSISCSGVGIYTNTIMINFIIRGNNFNNSGADLDVEIQNNNVSIEYNNLYSSVRSETTSIDPWGENYGNVPIGLNSTANPYPMDPYFDEMDIIVLDNATIEDDQVVLLDLTPLSFDFSKVQSNWEDLRFVSADGLQLDFEVEERTKMSDELIYIKVPDLGTSSFVMYYGNSEATTVALPSGSLSGSTISTRASVLEAWLYDDDWDYKEVVELSIPTPCPYYQVKVELDSSSINYSKFEVAGADFRVSSSRGKPLDYWIESWDELGTSIIWVEVPRVQTTTFYIHHGNSNVSCMSNGFETFDLFDDFETGTLPSTEVWEFDSTNPPNSYVEIVDGKAVIYSSTSLNCRCTTLQGFTNDWATGGTYGTVWNPDLTIANGNSRSSLGGPPYLQAVHTQTDNADSINEIRWISSEKVVYRTTVANNTVESVHTIKIPTTPVPAGFFSRAMRWGPGLNHGAWLHSLKAFSSGSAIRMSSWTDYDYTIGSGAAPAQIEVEWVFVRKCADNESAVDSITGLF
ncbi:MAG: DUF2341 domain-containing protein [Promethearchaeota archaeon]